MKIQVCILFVIIGFSSFSQNQDCGQLPMDKVDYKAQMSSNLAMNIQNKISDDSKYGDYKGLFKIYVDCIGAVYKVNFEKGDILEPEVDQISKSIKASNWKPAYMGHESVNSIVFVSIILGNGEVQTEVVNR